MNRRDFHLGLLTSVLCGQSSLSLAQSAEEKIQFEGELPPLPDDLIPFENVSPVTDYSESVVVGVAEPKSLEVNEASAILLAAPWGVGTKPIDVARYFLDIGAGKYGPSYKKYIREWPVRANPVIHQFFVATKTYPSGDTTAWCAAFVNWCIARSQASEPNMIGTSPKYYVTKGIPFPDETLMKFTSQSAASGSFRCFPETKVPDEGDIVVWFRPGTEKMTAYCAGQGHVAFFVKYEGEKIRVIGGNQSDGLSNGAVTAALWPKSLGDTHRLFGVRSHVKAT